VSVIALCASHTPLKDFHDPGEEARAEVARCFTEVKAWIRAFAPELVVVFGPDHFNGFFYRLMPSFCIGAAAESVGDWNTPPGALPVASAEAEACVRHLHQAGVDVAISYHMEIDHGLTQTLQMTLDWPDLPPILPIFINCAAPPLPPLARVVALGQAVGGFVQTLHKRVLIVGSGGLSHDPPMPVLANASPAVRERIVVGGPLAPEARAARQANVINEGLQQTQGASRATALNPVWDQHILALLMARDFASLGALDDDSITAAGGCGGHEIRSWVATAAAMSVTPGTAAELRMYRAIPVWVAGFGVMTIE
jgi:2,3-dihydroxyphenylpropionate 1,2-dioxygenase